MVMVAEIDRRVAVSVAHNRRRVGDQRPALAIAGDVQRYRPAAIGELYHQVSTE